MLLCTEEPQRWLPHAYVQAVSYADERIDTKRIRRKLVAAIIDWGRLT